MTISIPPPHSPDFEFEQIVRHCPNRIGRGTTREVLEIPGHPDKVLKVMHVPGNYQNWAEMLVYHSAGDNQRFFAQVHSISWSGKFMVMERLSKVAWEELSPVVNTFPRFANDREPSNFGKDSAGSIKMLDYALIELGPPPGIPPPTMLSSSSSA